MYCEKCGNNMGNMNVCSRCGHVVNMGRTASPWRADDSRQAESGSPGYGNPPWEAAGPGQTEDNSMGQSASSWEGSFQAENSGALYGTQAQGTDTSGWAGDNGAQVQKALSMRWYKFIINFQLFLAAIVNVANAGYYFWGLNYGENAELVYMFYESLQVLDIFMGVVMLALAALCIYARGRLRRFRKNAVSAYLSLIIINMICQIIYTVAVCGIVGYLDVAAAMGLGYNTVANAALLIGNYIYFKKRKHLFNS